MHGRPARAALSQHMLLQVACPPVDAGRYMIYEGWGGRGGFHLCRKWHQQPSAIGRHGRSYRALAADRAVFFFFSSRSRLAVAPGRRRPLKMRAGLCVRPPQ